MRRHKKNYSDERTSLENYNYDDKYHFTGESSFSRDLTIPFDENEVLSEKNYSYKGPSGGAGNHRGKGPKGYKRNDQKIFEEVCETLYQSPDVDATQIDVEVKEGVVTLRGAVESRIQKRFAERVLDGVSGIQDIHNELRFEQKDSQ